MKRKTILIPILVLLALLTGACSNRTDASLEAADFIIPIDIADIVKRSEAESAAYFEERRADFEALAEYLLASEAVFQTRPVILHREHAVELIEDPALQAFARAVFDDGIVQNITSLNDNPAKRVNLLIDYVHGVYRQGIAYLSLPEMTEEQYPALNYVQSYTDLGGGWYYYVHHYDNIKDADRYRELGWELLSDGDRAKLRYPKDQAVVTLEPGTNVGYWLEEDRRKPELVAAVEFNTEQDGLLGPIKLYFDPTTGELLGSAPRY